jgi:short subunit dehydrogenase-like uncharacterized protein
LSAPAGPIAVYGATGYTGRLVARELKRRGLPFVLSGRDPEKLRSVASSVGGAEIRVASVGDRDALRHAFGDCVVVINCAGPFTKFGEAVVRAAVETGTHYLDTTGEQPFMKLVVDRYDEPARAAEVAVITAMGFDFVPGDLLCRVAARDVEPLSELDLAYVVAGFGATRGTLRSTLEAMKGGDVVWEDGAWKPADAGPLRSRVRFPEPFGDQVVAKYPCGEIVSVPRHTRVRTIKARISVSEMAPMGPFTVAMPALMAGMAPLLRTPLRGALQTAIGSLPEGPPEDERAAARFMIAVRARGEDGRVRDGLVRGTDVYGLTAVTTVHGAALLAAPDYAESGALSPASAFDPVAFLDHLTDHGLSWEVSA